MKIKKSSWHYKFLKSTETFVPESLCEYWSKIIQNMFLITVAIVVFIGVSIMVGNASMDYVGNREWFYSHGMIFGNIASLGLGVMGLILLVLLIGFVVYCVARIGKSDGSFIKYIKNKSNKVCTKIEFED